jgi:rubrerythrin
MSRQQSRRLESSMFLIADIIALAIQIEHNAEKVYRSALKKTSDSKLASMLQWLADEEVEHARWFHRLNKTLRAVVTDPKVESMGQSLLSEVLGSQSFSLKENNLNEIIQLDGLLSLAVEFEKDKVIFYNMLRPFIADQETLAFLENIIKEKTNHIQELNTFMGRETEKGKLISET